MAYAVRYNYKICVKAVASTCRENGCKILTKRFCADRTIILADGVFSGDVLGPYNGSFCRRQKLKGDWRVSAELLQIVYFDF